MNYHVLKDQDSIAFTFEGVNDTPWYCIFSVREEEEQIMFYSTLMENIKLKYMEDIINYIVDENYRLVVGNFEIDRKDGELNYKTAIDCKDINVTASLLDGIMFNNLRTMDRHILNLELINNGKKPKPITDGKENGIKFENPNWKDSLGDLE